jgi:low affinity Fe/Cu permease
MKDAFLRFARMVNDATAHPAATAIAAALIIAWAVSGPRFHFSDTWQLIMNTASSIITFLMVFIIANAQKRDTEALNLKLDLLIAMDRALGRKGVGIESATSAKLQELREEIDASLNER